ncbi:hypothetical protein [Microbulbifer aestuariivivens]|uniref:hypothetical protein n=1 Tax=Microbulbifer aestuariivivens TaxID=1908308 RepID=UPI0031E8CC7B
MPVWLVVEVAKMNLKSTFRSILLRVWDFSLFITGEGSWKLRYHEKLIIDEVVKSLGDEQRDQICRQLSQPFFVQRMHGGRVNTICFYHEDEKHRVHGNQFEDSMIKVDFTADGKKQRAHVVFYKGFINKVEFKKEGGFYRSKTIKVCSISCGDPEKSHSAALDRLEHGRSEEGQ